MSALLKMEMGTQCPPLLTSPSMKVLFIISTIRILLGPYYPDHKDMTEKACDSKQDSLKLHAEKALQFVFTFFFAEKALPAGFPQIIQNPAMKVNFIMNGHCQFHHCHRLCHHHCPLSKSPSILLLSSSRPEAFQAHINHTQSYSSTQVVEKARHAVLVCEASGSPKPTITWIKDTMPIDLKANPRLSLMKQGKLRGKAAVTKFGRFYVRKPFYNCTQTS